MVMERSADFKIIRKITLHRMTKLSCNAHLIDIFGNVVLRNNLFVDDFLLCDQLCVALNLFSKFDIHGSKIWHVYGLLFDLKLNFGELVNCQFLFLFDVFVHFTLVKHVNPVLLFFDSLCGVADADLRLVSHLLTLTHLLQHLRRDFREGLAVHVGRLCQRSHRRLVDIQNTLELLWVGLAEQPHWWLQVIETICAWNIILKKGIIAHLLLKNFLRIAVIPRFGFEHSFLLLNSFQ